MYIYTYTRSRARAAPTIARLLELVRGPSPKSRYAGSTRRRNAFTTEYPCIPLVPLRIISTPEYPEYSRVPLRASTAECL